MTRNASRLCKGLKLRGPKLRQWGQLWNKGSDYHLLSFLLPEFTWPLFLPSALTVRPPLFAQQRRWANMIVSVLILHVLQNLSLKIGICSNVTFLRKWIWVTISYIYNLIHQYCFSHFWIIKEFPRLLYLSLSKYFEVQNTTLGTQCLYLIFDSIHK